MTHAHPNDDTFGEFAAEFRALAEVLLERIEPTLRRAAADGREWDSCSWCPVCAAAALVRGEHHDVVTAVADHGTAIVTVLREALAGVPVEPLLPDDWGAASDHGADRPDEKGIHPEAGDARPGGDEAGPGVRRGERRGAGDETGQAAKHGKRGRHSATERPGYIHIPVRIKE